MKMIQQSIANRNAIGLLLFFLIVTTYSPAQNGRSKKNIEQRPDLSKHFEKYGYDGAFLMYDLKKKKYITFNPRHSSCQYSPASTFKIFNSLVALETGVVKDSSYVIPWDGVQRWLPAWNRDQSLRSAFAFSAVWYYQEVARRIGGERMKKYIEQESYGNKDISGGIDIFWLESSLKISPEEQMEFLIKLYKNQLKSFSLRSVQIVKDIMLTSDRLPYKIRAKTGSAGSDSTYQGWYVGWIEKGKDVYFFVTHYEAPTGNFQTHGPRRKEITREILKELGVIN